MIKILALLHFLIAASLLQAEDDWKSTIATGDAMSREIILQRLMVRDILASSDDHAKLLELAKSSKLPADVRTDSVAAIYFSVFHGYGREAGKLHEDVSNELLAIAKDPKAAASIREQCARCLSVCFDETPYGKNLEEEMLTLAEQDIPKGLLDVIIQSPSLKPTETGGKRIAAIRKHLTSVSTDESAKVGTVKIVSHMKLARLLPEGDFQELCKTAFEANPESVAIRTGVIQEIILLEMTKAAKIDTWLVDCSRSVFSDPSQEENLRIWSGMVIVRSKTDDMGVVEVAWREVNSKSSSTEFRKTCLKIVKSCILDDEVLLNILTK